MKTLTKFEKEEIKQVDYEQLLEVRKWILYLNLQNKDF